MVSGLSSLRAHLLRSLRGLHPGRVALHVVVFTGLGLVMNGLGHLLSIAWFRSWWQVVPCYAGYVLPLALLVRDLPLGQAWRSCVLAFIPLELVGYAIGTSVIAEGNVIAAVLGAHNFTLAMVVVVSPTPLLGLWLVGLVDKLQGAVPPSSAP